MDSKGLIHVEEDVSARDLVKLDSPSSKYIIGLVDCGNHISSLNSDQYGDAKTIR